MSETSLSNTGTETSTLTRGEKNAALRAARNAWTDGWLKFEAAHRVWFNTSTFAPNALAIKQAMKDAENEYDEALTQYRQLQKAMQPA
ncbi:MAG: hypothetical protein DMF62_03255 [Acidobacteria bacterium]|nr:MAG: hypothetical protein DMF62_03255 [Acidobacteriota bacterium]PYT00189.1 MAG: hypothetical protein DMF63_08405 [Acidobacteriota bacterium]